MTSMTNVINDVSTETENSLIKMATRGVTFLFGLFYINMFMHSTNKWIHVSSMALLFFVCFHGY